MTPFGIPNSFYRAKANSDHLTARWRVYLIVFSPKNDIILETRKNYGRPKARKWSTSNWKKSGIETYGQQIMYTTCIVMHTCARVACLISIWESLRISYLPVYRFFHALCGLRHATRSRLDSCVEQSERIAPQTVTVTEIASVEAVGRERDSAPSGGGAWRYWLTVYTYTDRHGCVAHVHTSPYVGVRAFHSVDGSLTPWRTLRYTYSKLYKTQRVSVTLYRPFRI